jgi:DNA-binding response OmpR family regulator
MAKILLLEDDPILGKSLEVALKSEDHQVSWCHTMNDGQKAFHSQALDLLIVDVNLPDGTGYDFTQQVREGGSRLPVLMLTARNDEDSVVQGFESGANDYVRKPFSQKELFARIRVLLKEVLQNEEKIRSGPILVLTSQRRILIKDEEVGLNRREFDIFLYLARHLDAVVRREDILERLDSGSEIFDRTVDSHVSHIRSKLKRKGVTAVQIESVYGVGYRLKEMK